MPTWRIALYSVVAGAGAAWLWFNGLYEYLLSRSLAAEPPGSNGAQAGIGEAFISLYTAPVVGMVVISIVWIVLRRVTRKAEPAVHAPSDPGQS